MSIIEKLGCKHVDVIATAPEMLEALIECITTYEVQMEIFNNTVVSGNIEGSWLLTPRKIRETIEKATNKTWEEIKELMND